ncbi:MAG: hypothetical protein ACP5KP_02730, partial [Candidatus Micrarchaeia archaeon]
GVPGYGIIMIMDDNSPFTIGDIGFLPTNDDDYGKGLAVLTEIKEDGIVGVAVFPKSQLITDETRIASR